MKGMDALWSDTGRMLGYPGWEWHQKLTVEVETPNGVAVGSAVTESIGATNWICLLMRRMSIRDG